MNENEILSSDNKPNYWLLPKICYIAIFFEILSVVQNIGLKNTGGKLGIFVKIANSIPEWLTIICCGFLLIYLLLGLRKHYIMTNAYKPIPFISLIFLSIGVCLIALIIEFVIDESIIDIIEIIGILIIIPACIFEFIVGFKLKKRLKEAHSVGIMMMIWAIVPIVVHIIGIGFSEDDYSPWWAYIIDSGICIIFYWILSVFFGNNENRDMNDGLIDNGTNNIKSEIEFQLNKENAETICTKENKESRGRNGEQCNHVIIENQSIQGSKGQTIIINQVEKQSNGVGTAGFVLALIALFLSWVPGVGWFMWLLGLILSFVGMFNKPRGLAITGFIISLIDLIALIFIVGAIATFLK